jgi:hypothetical protein
MRGEWNRKPGRWEGLGGGSDVVVGACNLGLSDNFPASRLPDFL